MSQELIFCTWADVVIGSIVVKPIGINKTVELKVVKKEIDDNGFIQVWYEDKSTDRFNFYKSQVVVKKRSKAGENLWSK